jgi:DNA mismatch endonuclease (patch repair protein)
VDIAFMRARVAVFVDGCFWHGCPSHGTVPRKTNAAFWRTKVDANRERDQDTDARLRRAGWRVVRLWEHESPASAATRVERTVRQRSC